MMGLPKKKNEEGGGLIVLMLGLYLIVLAFFILLNAISQISEERFKKASESIASGFGFEAVQHERKQSDEDLNIIRVYEALSVEIREALESYVPLKDFDVEQASLDQMIVRLKPDAFFADESSQLKGAQVGFFQDMAKLMATPRSGIQLRVDVVVNTGVRPATSAQAELAGRRAAMFVRAFAERDVASRLLTAEVREIAEPQIVLLFYADLLDSARAADVLKGGGK